MSKSVLRHLLLPLVGLACAVVSRAADPAPATAAPVAAPAPEVARAVAPDITPAVTTATDTTPDLAKQLAGAEDKLATALRSYTLLQNENDQLRANAARDQAAMQAAADKAVTEAQATAGRVTLEATSQVSALNEEVRLLRAQAAALATENAQLKTRLAISGPPPGTTLVSPTRPGPAAEKLKPEPIAPKPEPAPRTHTVVAGDSLTKISKQYYGTPDRWEEILKANRGVIKNENSLAVGATLKIP